VSLVVARGGLIDRSNQGDSRNLRRADTPPSPAGACCEAGGSFPEPGVCEGVWRNESSQALAGPRLRAAKL
jgi:hypothetical protein